MKRPEKLEEFNIHNKGYNAGLQDERDYRDWLVDNADIEGLIHKNRVCSDTGQRCAKAIRQLLKREK
jgi:hypothetical protein